MLSYPRSSHKTLSEDLIGNQQDIDFYSQQITQLQQVNSLLNSDNQILVDQFKQLTEYNQTLGDELAGFDIQIISLESQVNKKNKKFKKLTKEGQNLTNSIVQTRKSLVENEEFSESVQKLKVYEEKKRAIINKLNSLRDETIQVTGQSVIESRDLLMEEVQELEQSNKDYQEQLKLLETLTDPTKTDSEKKKALDQMIIMKETEQKKILDDIYKLNQSGTKAKSPKKESKVEKEKTAEQSEFADDEGQSLSDGEGENKNEKSTSSKKKTGDDDEEDKNNNNLIIQPRKREASKKSKSSLQPKKTTKTTSEDDIDEELLKKKSKKSSSSLSRKKSSKKSDKDVIRKSKKDKSASDMNNSEDEKETTKRSSSKSSKKKHNSETDDTDNQIDIKSTRKRAGTNIRQKTTPYKSEDEDAEASTKAKSNKNKKQKNDKESQKSSRRRKKEEEEENHDSDEEKSKTNGKKSSRNKNNNDNLKEEESNSDEENIRKLNKKDPINIMASFSNSITNVLSSQLDSSIAEEVARPFEEGKSLSISNSMMSFSKQFVRVIKKKPDVEKADKEVQTEVDEIDEVIKNKQAEFSAREKESRAMLNKLHEEITGKLNEKDELEHRVKKASEANFETVVLHTASIAPMPDAVLDLSLHVIQSRTIAVQTDVTGESIDFHMKLLEDQVAEMIVASDLQDSISTLQRNIRVEQEKIEHAKAEGKARDQQIAKIKNDLERAKENLESEQLNQDLETRMKQEIINETQRLKRDIRSKQLNLDQVQKKNTQQQEKLEELIRIRTALERDLEDMSQREKPEIQTLSQEVQSYHNRVIDSQNKLGKAENDLSTRRTLLKSLKNSDEMKLYKDLIIKKTKLERRLLKWKMLLKDSRETLQSLEAFSNANYQKRQTLSETLEKYEREKVDREDELRDLESYSSLLSALLHEQNENWRNV